MDLQDNVKVCLLSEKNIQLGTASAKGIPNVCYIGCRYFREDGSLVMIDNFMRKTKANVLENPNVAVLVLGDNGAFQLKGLCRYVDKGEEYDAARAWMKARNKNMPAKGALVIELTEVYNSKPGEHAGEKIA